MTAAIRIDPETGSKLFNTRASQATEKIVGKGYSTITDDALKTLPPQPLGAIFDAEEQAKYRAFKEARRGAADYINMEGEFTRYLEDVYSTDPVERDSLSDTCEMLVVGAGFGGLMLWYKLQKSGFTDVRFCEKGGDVGGTWYWNRYPGIACDVEAYSYLPLLEEMGYFPTMKFASGFEILEYCQSIAEKFGFYDRCLFHTTVEKTVWDEDAKRWTVITDRGDAMRARYVVLANGILTNPRLARIAGMETFKGDSFHTSRWDYTINLENKRVGILGTGATAVQVIPEIAKVVKELYVFQRTPSSIDVRDQRETTEEEIEIKDGRRKAIQRKVFPGYILVQMEMNDDSWYVVRNTPGVTGFISAEDSTENRSKPVPLEQHEVDRIINRMKSEAPRVKIGFETGDGVRIKDGPFVDFMGTVDEVFLDRGKVRVHVSFFGRETPVELDFLQLEKT